ncbi:unnamed protein product [Oppiella nova]|uniref:Gamma-glutamylcyclotransferase n=1 Tax=Oppiella nova TaxID=334625 RepID=A0A7R9QL17_9ACAR|nr:unnamed protein product [Oppiella nova]CAG2167116.1 unnamed protein product [Oppiella nova]
MEEEGVSTWGRAFQFIDEASTLAYLTNRESSLGGYNTVIAQFHPRDPKEDPFPVLVYIALPCNSLFLGSAPLDSIAKDIALSEGMCGPNVEYLAKLSAFMRIHLPHESDDHLYRLEDLVRKLIREHEECDDKLEKIFDEALEREITDLTEYKSVIHRMDELTLDDNSYHSTTSSASSSSSSLQSANSTDIGSSGTASQWLSSESTSRHTDRVTARKLRCINK